MRRVTALAGSAALLLLAGCSSSEDTSASVAGSTSRPGASSSASTAPPTATRTKQAVPGSGPSPTGPTTAAPGGSAPPVNQRGNIVKALGQEGGITDESGSDVLTFSINAIRPDIACDSGFDDPPANGHYIGIDLRVSTTAGLTAADYVTFSEYDFSVIGSDGVTVTSVDGNAWSCLDDPERFPGDALGPAQTYVGTIVIDAPITSGTLIFAPSLLGLSTGWEWQF